MSRIALSYSRLSTYEQCPRKFQSQYLTKTYPDESDNPHFVRGSKIHKQLEEYTIAMALNGENLPELSPEAENAKGIIHSVFDNYDEIYAEQQIAIDDSWNKISWFDRGAYYRAILDLVAIAGNKGLIIDWKTGKVRDYDDSDTGQLHLSAAILMAIKPQLDVVDVAYSFVEHKHTIKRRFERAQLEELQNPFKKSFITVNCDNEFEPKKNKYCYFCNINPDECELKR